MESINRLLREHRLPQLDHERYQRVFQFPIIEYYRKAGFDFEQESFESLAPPLYELLSAAQLVLLFV